MRSPPADLCWGWGHDTGVLLAERDDEKRADLQAKMEERRKEQQITQETKDGCLVLYKEATLRGLEAGRGY